MKCIVTGGAGFIGSNLVKLLLSQGNEVRVLDNFSTGYEKNLDNLDVDIIKGDIRNKELVENSASDIDVIFHLAAHIGNVKSINNSFEDSEINVLGTLNILEAARKKKVGKIIYSSSAAIFGELVTMPIDENHPQNPDSPYGVSKLSAEKHVLCYGKLFDIVTVCLRYFNVYGINQRYDAYGNVITIFANRLFENKHLIIYGDGKQTRDFVNVKNVAMANYLASVKSQKSDVFNVGSGTEITINELAVLVQDAGGMKTEIDYEPPRKGEVIHCRADISKIKKELGFEPDTDIRLGLSLYFDWFKKDKTGGKL
jgi:nucleoside-diphosphate-sugar epimerase